MTEISTEQDIQQRIIDLSGTEEGFWILVDHLNKNNSFESLEKLISCLNRFPFKCSFYFFVYVDFLTALLIDRINSEIGGIDEYPIAFHQRSDYYHYLFLGKEGFYRYKEEGVASIRPLSFTLNIPELLFHENYRYSFPPDPTEESVAMGFIMFLFSSVIDQIPPQIRQSLSLDDPLEENMNYPTTLTSFIDGMLEMSNIPVKEFPSLSEKYDYFFENMGKYLEELKKSDGGLIEGNNPC